MKSLEQPGEASYKDYSQVRPPLFIVDQILASLLQIAY
jgi:hypothetical protein